jgi:hypothetical protein
MPRSFGNIAKHNFEAAMLCCCRAHNRLGPTVPQFRGVQEPRVTSNSSSTLFYAFQGHKMSLAAVVLRISKAASCGATRVRPSSVVSMVRNVAYKRAL